MNQDALNSATKYPSIQTYHKLGERGRLTDEVQVPFEGMELVYATEKIDGTNSRIIQLPGRDWYIGSREELLSSRGDRVANPAQGIVAALKNVAQGLPELRGNTVARVWFLETYGGKTSSGAKQYTGRGKVGFRLFDSCTIPLEVLTREPEDVATWRDNGGRMWAFTDELDELAVDAGLTQVPVIWTGVARDLPPTSIDGTYGWLGEVFSDELKEEVGGAHTPMTFAGLDDGAGGRPEGIVVRTDDRKKIAKLRFEDYERTLRAKR